MTDQDLHQYANLIGQCAAEGRLITPMYGQIWLDEIIRLRALVKDAECPNEDQCPWCRTYTQPGHARPHEPDCPAFTPDGKVK